MVNKNYLIYIIIAIMLSSFITAVDVAPYAFPIDIPDITISSDEWVLAKTVEFNTSGQESFIMLSAINFNQTNFGGDTQVYGNITVDGVTVLSQLLRTINVGEEGVSGFDPVNFTVGDGTHNLSIYFRREGLNNNVDVDIFNIDFAVGQFNTSDGHNVRGNISLINTSFQSSTDVLVYNRTIQKIVNTSTYLNAKVSVRSDTGEDTVICRMIDGTDSPDFIVTVPGNGGVRTESVVYIAGSDDEIENISMRCRSTNNQEIFIYGSLIEVDLKDEFNDTINYLYFTDESINYTNPLNLPEGRTAISNRTFNLSVGYSIYYSAFGSFRSASGLQTLKGEIEITNSSGDLVCHSEKVRSTNGDIGNGFFYKLCPEIQTGQELNLLLYFDVPPGEIMTVYDGGIAVFEYELFDTSSVNVPPILAITNPNTGGQVYSLDNITWNVADPEGNRYLTHIYLNETPVVDNLTDDITNYEINWSLYADGDYTLRIETCENETASLFCTNDTETIEINSILKNVTNCGEGTGHTITELVPYYIEPNTTKILIASLYDENGTVLNSSVATAYINLDDTGYSKMTYNESSTSWYSLLTSTSEEDSEAMVYFGNTEYQCINETYLIKFRTPYYLNISLFYANTSTIEPQQYENDFNYVYLKQINDSSSSTTNLSNALPSTNSVNNLMSSIFSWVPGIEILYPSNIDTEVVFWGEYNSGKAEVKLYENGTYNIYVLTHDIDGLPWYYEFFKPQQSKIKVDSKLTQISLPNKNSYEINVFADQWEFDKIGILINIVKTVIITLLIILGMGLVTFLPGGSKLVGLLLPVAVGIGLKILGVL